MDAATSSTPAAVVAPPQPPQAVMVWPQTAQLATVFLLGLATTLLAIHSYRGLRWGSRPTEFERDLRPAYRIDLNRADQIELSQIPGVGDKLAQSILEYRRRQGPFRSVDELQRVERVGADTVERLRPWLFVRTAEIEREDDPHREISKLTYFQGGKVAASNKDPDGRPAAGKKEMAIRERIDLNHATAADLQRLPGIGPKRAQQIIDERQKRPFTTIEELRRVSGVGPKILDKLRPYITVETDSIRIATTGGS